MTGEWQRVAATILIIVVAFAGRSLVKWSLTPPPEPWPPPPSPTFVKIDAALKETGITKNIAAILDAEDDAWLIFLQPEDTRGESPPRRPIPEFALVNKKTFEAKRTERPKPQLRNP